MPMGYGTLIGDMGTVLSGGQKQRVLIARALYRRPGILFLDEATSHLDVDREKAVNDALRLTQMTRIIIAHRPETIRASGRVITLKEGEIAENVNPLFHSGYLNGSAQALDDEAWLFAKPRLPSRRNMSCRPLPRRLRVFSGPAGWAKACSSHTVPTRLRSAVPRNQQEQACG